MKWKQQKTAIAEEHRKRKIEIHDAYRGELIKRQLSNTENYDRTILTLSSSGLALSLTAIKFAIPLATAKYLFLLKFSWWLFGVTIFISIGAYWVSNKALDKQLEIAYEYYIKDIEDAFLKKNLYSIINNTLNVIVGLTFLIATVLIIIFVTLNISGDSEMVDKTNKITLDSASIPKMQAISEPLKAAASATVPVMQFAPTQNSKPNKTTQNAGGNGSVNKNKK